MLQYKRNNNIGAVFRFMENRAIGKKCKKQQKHI